MANQTVVSAAAIWQALFDTLTGEGQSMDFTQSGEVYFVDINAGLDTNSGADWDNPFLTLDRAIKVSNASIAARRSGWASRNKIYLKGDACDEDLTTGATKCDIIGVGSCDAQPRARILGTHAFTGGSTLMGMRFINIEFWDDGATYNLTFTTCDGIAFHNCVFTCASSSLGALRWLGATGNDITIKNCVFRPKSDGDPFDTAAISLEQTTCNGLLIENCIVEGDIALNIDSTNVRQGYVRNSLFKAVTFCVDDESDDVVYAKCEFISATTKAGALDLNEDLCVGCKITSSDGTISVPGLNPLIIVKAITPPTSGIVYYVHKGGDNDGGKTWEHAFTTIAAAITASNLTVSWADNEEDNTILIAPGAYDETLTTLPYYCHMIGLGMPTLASSACSVKIHPASGVCMSGDTVIGLHLKNLCFRAVGAVDLLDFVVANDVLIENCLFEAGDNSVVNFISTENSDGLQIIGCKFKTATALGQGATRGILFQGGSEKYWHNGVIRDCVIEGIDAAGTGIKIESTCTGSNSIIERNTIVLTGAGTGIDENSDNVIVQDNKVYHVGGTAYDVNAKLASQNIANANGTVTMEPNMPT